MQSGVSGIHFWKPGILSEGSVWKSSRDIASAFGGSGKVEVALETTLIRAQRGSWVQCRERISEEVNSRRLAAPVCNERCPSQIACGTKHSLGGVQTPLNALCRHSTQLQQRVMRMILRGEKRGKKRTMRILRATVYCNSCHYMLECRSKGYVRWLTYLM